MFRSYELHRKKTEKNKTGTLTCTHYPCTMDESHPSFFEMYAQGALISGLKPALRHAFTVRFFFALFVFAFYVTTSLSQTSHIPSIRAQVLARHYPFFETMVQYNEEVFHALLWVLESHYLREYDSVRAVVSCSGSTSCLHIQVVVV